MEFFSRESPEKLLGPMGAFGLHTLTVYICAVHFSPWLVGRWFKWIMPLLGFSTTAWSADWYLQHLEMMSIIPAIVAGYVIARRPDSVGSWAWTIPGLVLVCKMILYRANLSVFLGTSMPALQYFFDIQRAMPTMTNPLRSDPGRVLAQMVITAPFYAGLAYSLGAYASKQKLLARLFSRGVRLAGNQTGDDGSKWGGQRDLH